MIFLLYTVLVRLVHTSCMKWQELHVASCKQIGKDAQTHLQQSIDPCVHTCKGQYDDN